MDKVKIAENAFGYPMPMTLVGAVVEGKINYMAVGWISRVNFNPPMIGVGLGKAHHTNRGIREHREFGVSVPSRDLIAPVDYAGLVSGSKTDKSQLFASDFGALKFAPMARECPLTMECKVVEIVELPTNEFFIGEIVGAYCRADCLTDGKPDLNKIAPYSLSMPDNQYWAVGEPLGQAWGIGKNYRRG